MGRRVKVDGERPPGVGVREQGARGLSRMGIEAYSESGVIKMAEVSALQRKKNVKPPNICQIR